MIWVFDANLIPVKRERDSKSIRSNNKISQTPFNKNLPPSNLAMLLPFSPTENNSKAIRCRCYSLKTIEVCRTLNIPSETRFLSLKELLCTTGRRRKHFFLQWTSAKNVHTYIVPQRKAYISSWFSSKQLKVAYIYSKLQDQNCMNSDTFYKLSHFFFKKTLLSYHTGNSHGQERTCHI